MLLLQRSSTSWSQRQAKVPNCWIPPVFVCVVIGVYPWASILAYTRKNTVEVECQELHMDCVRQMSTNLSTYALVFDNKKGKNTKVT